MIEISHKELLKYIIGILILLAFIAILGVYMFFLARIPLGANSASVLLANQSRDEEIEKRFTDIQKEIEDTLARVKALEDANRTTTPSRPTSETRPATPTTPAPEVRPLRISRFTANQTLIQSGSQVVFSYGAENITRGVSYRLLIQCPTGVTATYSNGSNICRRNIGEAVPIDNSGSYSVNFTNSSSEPGVVIAVLLASDLDSNNSIVLRDSRVMTLTIMPSQNYSYIPNGDFSVVLSNTPSGAPVPALISFTATINDLKTCLQSRWEFGDGMVSENFAVCPHNISSIKSRTLFENHQYNQPGTYTATFFIGDKKVSRTVYVSAPTITYNPPQYTPVYTYNPPTYNYVYNPQPPVYYYNNYPSIPDVPTTPHNFRAVASSNNGVTLSWSAPTYGNVVTYTVYRVGGSSLSLPIAGSPSICNSSSVGICYYNVSGNMISFTDNNVARGNTYSYRITASNGYGTSNFSDMLTVTLSESNSPTVPRTFTASVNNGRVTLNWSAPSSGSVTNYAIYRIGGSSLPVPITSSPSACSNGGTGLCYYFVSGQTSTIVDSNLLPNTTYTYRIIATNSFGSSEYSDSLTINSGQPEPPVSTPTLNPANRTDSLGVTQLSWNSVGAGYYRVYRSTTRNDAAPANDDLVAGCTAGTTNPCFLTVSGDTRISSLQVSDNQYDTTRTYYYRVRAYSQVGVSNWSNEVTAFPSTVTPPPPPPADPVITSFTVNGQTSPTVSSGSLLTLAYSGTNVSSYKLFIQCPSNVAAVDQSNSANICRTNSNDAVSVSSNGSYQIAVHNTGSSDQAVNATLLAYRANGTLSQSVTRSIVVRNIATPPPPPPPAVTSLTINGQNSSTVSVSSGSSVTLAYSSSQFASFKIYLNCPANVIVAVSANGGSLCSHNSSSNLFQLNHGSGPSGSFGSTGLTVNNGNSTNQSVNITMLIFKDDGSLLASISRTLVISGTTPPPTPDPVITSFTIDGQTSPTVSSGSLLTLAYSGTNVSSYKLFIQCPANVAAVDQSNSTNLCRNSANEAVSIPSTGNYQLSIYNMNSSNQGVSVTILAYRANGTVSNTLTRAITVRPQSGF